MSIHPSHQTVRLARGKHAGPDAGVCVMELASMLAGEPFSDHPECVCPVIAAYLRAYNDVTNETARQDLLRLASDAVDTVGSAALELARGERLAHEAAAPQRRRPWPFRLFAPRFDGAPATPPELERLSVALAKRLWRSGADGHARALSLADELVAMRDDGGSDRLMPRPPRPMVVA